MQNSIATSFELLQFIDSKKLSNWSVKYLLEGDFGYNENYELVPISTFLKRSKEQVTIQDNTNYERITIRQNNGGISLRDKLPGSKIGTKKQFLVRKGQFLLSKIDARNGAFGVVPDDVDGAIITGNFWTYNVDYSKVDPYYLALITTTPQFISFCQRSSAGTTNRHYLQETLFLKERIPLPLLSEQEEFSKAYRLKLQQADKLEQEATNLEEQIEEYLFEKLGIELEFDKTLKKGQLNLIDFKELDRWDLWNVLGNIKSNIYPLKKFGEVIIGKPVYGANVRGVKTKSDTRYIRITDINEDGSLNDEFVSPEKVQEKYLLKENDFLIARSGNTVGKTFLFKEKYGRCIYAGYLVKYNLGSEILPEFLLFYTKSKAFKHWITQNLRVSGQPNINGQEYLQFQLPVPPIKIQEEVVKDMSNLRREITAK